ncbi:MAG TPA: HAD family hydrolase [Candidatus Limnocylindrales bacterium]
MSPGTAGRAREPGVDPLEGIELVIFDKDGTLIEFDRMWRDWVADLGERLSTATRRPFVDRLFGLMGVDPASGLIYPHGLLAATPMARLRELVVEALEDEGIPPDRAEDAMAGAWHPPDPVALATPVTDLPALFDRLEARDIRSAVATADDRRPTERTLAALGIADRFEVLSCADDGHRVKPFPDPVHLIAAAVGVPVGRSLVVGDSPADMRMGRAAGAGRVVGVLTGVGDRAILAPLADLVLPSIAELLPA